MATMPLQTSLLSDNFKKFKPLLCPHVAELQRLSRNVIRCLPLSRLPSTLPVKDKNSKPLRLHTCPKNSICLFHTDTNFNYVNNNRLNEFVTANKYSIIIYSAEQQPASSEPSPRAITADSWSSVYYSGTVSKTDQFQDNNHPQHRTSSKLVRDL